MSQKLPVSAIALIGVNCIPLLGVIFAKWSVFNIVILYWMETVVIGFITVLRILTAKGTMSGVLSRMAQARRNQDLSPETERRLEQLGGSLGGGLKFFMVPFFCVHFGIFMSVHLMFIVSILGAGDGGVMVSGSPLRAFSGVLESAGLWLVLSVIAFLVSHLFSFFMNYIGKGENLKTTPPEQMMRPYGRVVVMHIAIILGSFAALALNEPLGVLLVLVVGKTIIDLKLHLKDHRKAQEKADERGAVLDLGAPPTGPA